MFSFLTGCNTLKIPFFKIVEFDLLSQFWEHQNIGIIIIIIFEKLKLI